MNILKMPKIFWSILPLISLTLCQNPEDYVVQLKFSYREDKIPQHIVTMLNNSMAETNITTSDILQLSGLDHYSLDQTIALLNYYNITTEQAFTVDSLEFILNTLGVTFQTFYVNLNKDIDPQTSMDVLADLEIDQIKFSTALVFVGMYDIYNVLREGSYSEENVAKALNKVQKTKEEVFALARDVVKNEVIKKKPDEFMAALASIGLNRRISLELWKALGITTSDVYAVEKFGNILKNTIDSLNANLTIAVITGESQLAIHDHVYNFCYVDTNVIKIESSNNEVIGYDGFISPKVVKLRLKTPSETKIEIASDYTTITNCTYITIAQNVVISEDVEVIPESNTLLLAKKSEDTVYNLGSPLVCNGFLYGMAGDQNDSIIFFDTFFEKGRPDLDDSADNSASILHCHLLVILLLVCISSSRKFY